MTKDHSIANLKIDDSAESKGGISMTPKSGKTISHSRNTSELTKETQKTLPKKDTTSFTATASTKNLITPKNVQNKEVKEFDINQPRKSIVKEKEEIPAKKNIIKEENNAKIDLSSQDPVKKEEKDVFSQREEEVGQLKNFIAEKKQINEVMSKKNVEIEKLKKEMEVVERDSDQLMKDYEDLTNEFNKIMKE